MKNRANKSLFFMEAPPEPPQFESDGKNSSNRFEKARLPAPARTCGARRWMQNSRLRSEGVYTYVERSQTRIGKRIQQTRKSVRIKRTLFNLNLHLTTRSICAKQKALTNHQIIYSFSDLRRIRSREESQINRTLTSAGLTPLIRDACPTLRGLMRLSFSAASIRSPRTVR